MVKDYHGLKYVITEAISNLPILESFGPVPDRMATGGLVLFKLWSLGCTGGGEFCIEDILLKFSIEEEVARLTDFLFGTGGGFLEEEADE